jgi:hypothetical protein
MRTPGDARWHGLADPSNRPLPCAGSGTQAKHCEEGGTGGGDSEQENDEAGANGLDPTRAPAAPLLAVETRLCGCVAIGNCRGEERMKKPHG